MGRGLVLGTAVVAGAMGCRPAGAARGKPATSSSCELVEKGAGPAGATPVRAEVVASGLEVPWGIAFPSKDEILLTERPGRIRLLARGALLPAPVATIPI